MPKVSVMMPAYNVEKYIGEAIESILNQTFQDFELLIVDDGSIDTTYQVMTDYAKKDARIRLFRNEENKGLVFTRNRLLDEAKGDYLAILDSDDIALPDRLEKQVRFLDENPEVGLLGGGVELFNDTTAKTEISKHLQGSDKIAAYLLFHNVFGQSTIMFRSYLKKLRYQPEFPPAEDYNLWVRMSWQTQTDNLPHVLARYRVHQHNISRLKREELLQSVRKTHLLQLERLGITATPSELDTHKLLADYRAPSSISDFKNALNWLKKLHDCNNKRKIYPKTAFDNELRVRLHELCLNAAYLGEESALLFASHPILKTLLDKKIRLKLWLLAKGKGRDTGKFYPFIYQMYKKFL